MRSCCFPISGNRTLIFAFCVWFLLSRDKRSSRALQTELVRRRRVRRGLGDESLKLAES